MKPTEESIRLFAVDAGPWYNQSTIVKIVYHFLERQANETSGDMLTFEESWGASPSFKSTEQLSEHHFNAARVGMIPAKNAITLPDESEWPEDARCIDVVFSYDGSELRNVNMIACVPRTKPQPIKMSLAEALERLEGVMGKPVEIV